MKNLKENLKKIEEIRKKIYSLQSQDAKICKKLEEKFGYITPKISKKVKDKKNKKSITLYLPISDSSSYEKEAEKNGLNLTNYIRYILKTQTKTQD
jgi:predicted DNA binding CopG/RHH family protein